MFENPRRGRHLVPAPKVSDLERVDCILPAHIFLRHPQNPNRDLKQRRRRRRRQRKRRKKALALKQHGTLHVHYTFWFISLPLFHDDYFLMWNLLTRLLMEDANSRRTYLSLSFLACGHQELNSGKVRIHSTFWAICYVWRNANSFLWWRFAVDVEGALASTTIHSSKRRHF